MFRRFARSRTLHSLVCSAALASVMTSETAQAGGYFLGPIGGQAVGRAGAFVAKANDLSAAYYNPAGFALVKGTRLQLDNKFSYNHIEFQREPVLDGMDVSQPFAPVSNEPKFQPLDPLLGVATDFGLSDFAFALVVYANSGVSKLEFPVDGGQRYMMTKRDGIFINYSLNAAWRPHPKWSFGISPQVIAVPELTYQLVVNGAPANIPPPNGVSNNYDILATVQGKDMFTLNAIVGAWFSPTPNIELGLSGQVLPAKIVTDGPITLDFLNPTQTLPIVTERGRGLPADDVTIELPLPMWAKLGGRYVGRNAAGAEVFDVELDVTYERWSVAERFTVDSNNLEGVAGATRIPVGVIQVEKQWQDVFAFNLGGDYAAVPDLLTLRAGAYYETAAAQPEYSSVDFVTGQQLGVTCGGTVRFGGLAVSLGYEFRHQPEVVTTTANGRVYQVLPSSSVNPGLAATRLAVNGGTFRANSHSAVLGLAYRF
jgi:long-chain fatty acid transport protein